MADTPATTGAVRIGVLRPASASTDHAIAVAEARVVRHELGRRLGEVSVDLRTEGSPIGPWQPLDHAAWPADIDATLDLGDVTGPESPRLIALFTRTLAPDAVDVRRRMLHHLGVLPVPVLNDEKLITRLPAPQRPTDVWLLVRDAERVATSEPRHSAFAAGIDEQALVDRWFDASLADLVGEPNARDTQPTVARLQAHIDDLQQQLTETQTAAARSERLAVEQLDALQTECEILRERLQRAELDAPVTG